MKEITEVNLEKMVRDAPEIIRVARHIFAARADLYKDEYGVGTMWQSASEIFECVLRGDLENLREFDYLRTEAEADEEIGL